MVDVEVVTWKLAELEARTERLRQRCPRRADELASDRDALEIVSFNLMLAVQATIDIASHLVADEGWAPATTFAESFERLAEHGVLTGSTAASMRRAAGLRNGVAHGYAAVDPARVHHAATAGLADLRAFAGEIAGQATSAVLLEPSRPSLDA